MGLAEVLPDRRIAPMILYDTSMILFCKDTRKVSFFQVFINQRLDVKITAENDTMTLLFGKTLLSPTGHYGLHGHIVSWRVLTI